MTKLQQKRTPLKNYFLKSVLIRINYYIVVWQLYISYWYITLRINLLIWCQFDVKFNLNLCKPFIYRLYLSNCFIVGTKSSTHDLIPFCKFYRLWMGFYSTSLHHSHLFREGKNEVWCKNWCKWCISLFSFGFYSITISPVLHSTTFSS